MHPNAPNAAALQELLASGNPNQLDVWINDSDNRYIIGVHNDHKGGTKTYLKEMPDGTRQQVQGGPSLRSVLIFEPHSETSVPREFRNDIQVVQCSDPECQASPRTRGRCPKDHAGIVIGGKCPGLRRKGTEGIVHIPECFDANLIEVVRIGKDGRKYYTLERPEDIIGDGESAESVEALLERKRQADARAALAKRKAPKPAAPEVKA